MRWIFGLFSVKRGTELFSILLVLAISFMFYHLLSWGGVRRVMILVNVLLILALSVMIYIVFAMLKNPEIRSRFNDSRKAYLNGDYKNIQENVIEDDMKEYELDVDEFVYDDPKKPV